MNAQLRPDYKQTEIGVIPENWRVVCLGELFEITSSKRVFQSEWKTNGVPFFRAREIAVLGEAGTVDNDLFISQEMYDSFRRTFGVPKTGDMLVTGVGTLGKVYVVPDAREFYFKDGNIIWFKIDGAVNSSFLRQLYLTRLITKQIADSSAGTTVGTYTISGAKKTIIPLPPSSEQQAIAEALSDADALIASLEQLVAKKRHIKQGTMQELLTGKRRLPGFTGEWVMEDLEDLAIITTGSKNTQDRVEDGQFPFFVRSQTVERINSYSFDGEAVLTAGDGVGTGKVFHYINGKFDAHQRVYRISDFSERINGYFFYLYFSNHFYNRIMQMTAKSSVDSVRREMIAKMPIPLPPTRDEQTAIATALSDMDAEIVELEAQLAKTRTIKQGMMQKLLTGEIRLL